MSESDYEVYCLLFSEDTSPNRLNLPNCSVCTEEKFMRRVSVSVVVNHMVNSEGESIIRPESMVAGDDDEDVEIQESEMSGKDNAGPARKDIATMTTTTTSTKRRVVKTFITRPPPVPRGREASLALFACIFHTANVCRLHMTHTVCQFHSHAALISQNDVCHFHPARVSSSKTRVH